MLLGGFWAIEMAKVVCVSFIQNLIMVLLVFTLTCAIGSDVNCLRSIKSQLRDPNGNLSSWEFKSITDEGYLCHFTGVKCWSTYKVETIDLSGFGLEGEFPSGVKECSSLQHLNLHGNNLSGILPPDLFSFLPYLVTLYLSGNSFSGEIPATWSNIGYLNVLSLDYNQLTGHIPPGLALSPRLNQFSVSYNNLTGPIPQFTNAYLSASSFQGNPGLCGFPLDTCPPDPSQDSVFSMAITPAACAAAFFLPIGAFIGWFWIGNESNQRPSRR